MEILSIMSTKLTLPLPKALHSLRALMLAVTFTICRAIRLAKRLNTHSELPDLTRT
jgi:hypothetical protein